MDAGRDIGVEQTGDVAEPADPLHLGEISLGELRKQLAVLKAGRRQLVQLDRRLGPMGQLTVLQEGGLGRVDPRQHDRALPLDQEQLDGLGDQPGGLAALDVLDVVELVEDQQLDPGRAQQAVDPAQQHVLTAMARAGGEAVAAQGVQDVLRQSLGGDGGLEVDEQHRDLARLQALWGVPALHVGAQDGGLARLGRADQEHAALGLAPLVLPVSDQEVEHGVGMVGARVVHHQSVETGADLRRAKTGIQHSGPLPCPDLSPGPDVGVREELAEGGRGHARLEREITELLQER